MLDLLSNKILGRSFYLLKVVFCLHISNLFPTFALLKQSSNNLNVYIEL